MIRRWHLLARGEAMAERGWWEERWFVALMIFASAIPLLLPETPPLVDLPGHMGRYRIQLDLANSPDLQRYFEFHWGLIGNLGVDLLVMPLAPIFGLEGAVKLIVVAIPMITTGGILWLAQEIHGRIPPTAYFAIPFIYGFPFNFGFINFSLSIGLALVAFAFWLHLTRQFRIRLRNLIFIPLSCALWVVHVFGWGVLGLLVFAAELARKRDGHERWPTKFVHAAISTLPLAFPLILMAVWRSGSVAGDTDKFFYLPAKFYSLVAVLRDRWLIWDSFGVGAAIVLIGAAISESRISFSKRMALSACVLAVAFLIIPSFLFGSAYADIRLGPLMFMIAILAIRVEHGGPQFARRIAWLSLAYVAVRLTGNLVSFAIADRESREWLTALHEIPPGSSVLSLVGTVCDNRWAMPRYAHVASFVIIRRKGFTNDQWQVAGAQLLRINYPRAGAFADANSTAVKTVECLARIQRRTGTIQSSQRLAKRVLLRFPRDAFDYVWMIQPGDFDMAAMPGLTPIWRRKDAVLYRVDHERPRPN